MGRRKKKARKTGPVEPALVPLKRSVDALPGPPVVGVTMRYEGVFEENLASYIARQPADLASRPIGTWAHLQQAYRHAVVADHAITGLAKAIVDRGGNPAADVRANNAGVNVLVASHLLNSATILHVRPDATTHTHGLILVRSALESTGRAALIATGTKDEVHRWQTGTSITANECITALGPVLSRREPGAADVMKVYAWLCNFTHMNVHGVEHLQDTDPSRRDDNYCGHAYAAWAAAVVAEIITGIANLAVYPSPLVNPLPWDR